MSQKDMNQLLAKTLKELDSLLKQIHDTKSYSETNEYVACLRELVLEQIEGQASENPIHAAHTIR